MKNFSLRACWGTAFIFTSVLAQASPNDLVIYNETKSTVAYTVDVDQSGVQQIALLDCPVDVPVTSLSQCSGQRDLMALKDFPAFVKNVVVKWSKDHAGKPLAPLSTHEVSIFAIGFSQKNDPSFDAVRANIADLNAQLGKIQTMQKMMPSSTTYQAKATDLQSQISALQLKFNETNGAIQESAQIEATIDQAATALADLILKNDPKTTQPHFFATSMMQNTLALQVTQALQVAQWKAVSTTLYQGVKASALIRDGRLIVEVGNVERDFGGSTYSVTPLIAAANDHFLVFADNSVNPEIIIGDTLNNATDTYNGLGDNIQSLDSISVVGRSFFIRAIDPAGKLIQAEVKMDQPVNPPLLWTIVTP
jgi:hypothetical protein